MPVDEDYIMMVHMYIKKGDINVYKRLSPFSLRDEMTCKEGLPFTETASHGYLIIIMFNSEYDACAWWYIEEVTVYIVVGRGLGSPHTARNPSSN